MIEHSRGEVMTLNEVTYDRDALESFVNQFPNKCIIGSTKKGPDGLVTVGFNTINAYAKDGLELHEYPIIQNLLDKFTIDIDTSNIQISYYPPGFTLPAHTDAEWNAHIMFPIMPVDGGAELIFHDVPVAEHTRGGDYQNYVDSIDYTVKYSTQHPTIFNTQIPHSAGLVVDEPRIYLKFMIPQKGAVKFRTDTRSLQHEHGHTWAQLKQMAKEGTLFKDND